MSAVSTHVLDTARGEPASGVAVRLERVGGAGPGGAESGGAESGGAESGGAGPAGTELGGGITDADGRISDFGVASLPAGTYRLVFATGPYLVGQDADGAPGAAAFFPEVVVTFTADGQRARYHVPLLLSPFSYSTYRGS